MVGYSLISYRLGRLFYTAIIKHLFSVQNEPLNTGGYFPLFQTFFDARIDRLSQISTTPFLFPFRYISVTKTIIFCPESGIKQIFIIIFVKINFK